MPLGVCYTAISYCCARSGLLIGDGVVGDAILTVLNKKRNPHSLLRLKSRRCHGKHNNQTGHDQRRRDNAHDNDRSSASGEFATDDVVLRFEVSVEAQESTLR